MILSILLEFPLSKMAGFEIEYATSTEFIMPRIGRWCVFEFRAGRV